MAFRLVRLRDSDPAIVDKGGKSTSWFRQIWQTKVDKIESEVARLDTTLSAIKLTASYTNPVGVLTAQNNGSITVATHSRVYGDGTSVSVTGGALTGFANGAKVTVFYTDSAQSGGTVAYQGTTQAVAQVGSTHVVGQVTIPAAAAADNPGAGPTAPGYTAPVYDATFDPRVIEYLPF